MQLRERTIETPKKSETTKKILTEKSQREMRSMKRESERQREQGIPSASSGLRHVLLSTLPFRLKQQAIDVQNISR